MGAILGIDPGSRFTGWGIIRDRSGILELVDCGVIKTLADEEREFSERLALIFHELSRIIAQYEPDEAAAEQVFSSRNAQSALKLGQARGAAIAACAAARIKIYDYEPTLIKKSIVGAGRAEKNQVAFMVKRLLNMSDDKRYPSDTTDALAAALCRATMRRMERIAGKPKGT